MAVARSGVAATPPSPIAARATTPSATSSAKATATLEMSSNRRLAILWNAVERGDRQRDPHGADQLVRAAGRSARYPVK